MNCYVCTVFDWVRWRDPEEIIEEQVIDAATAEDAITFLRIRHNVPFENSGQRRALIDITPHRRRA